MLEMDLEEFVSAAAHLLFEKAMHWEVVTEPHFGHTAVLLAAIHSHPDDAVADLRFVVGRAGYDRAASHHPERSLEEQVAIIEARAAAFLRGPERKRLATQANRDRAQKLIEDLVELDNPPEQERTGMT